MNGETKQFELSNRLFVIAAVLIVAIALSVVVGIYIALKGLPEAQPREITVVGEGKIYIVPDIATVDISVVNEGNEQADIPAMIKKNTETMNALISDLKNLGIDEKDIKTTQYNLEPRYNWTENQGQVFIGYKITNTILVKIRDFTKIGAVLSKATISGGATSIGNIYFTIEDPEKARQEAREKAIEQAKAKAESIAKASGLKLGKILNISEGYYPYAYGGGEMLKANAEAAPSAPEIQPGQQEVSTTVYLTYRVR